MVQIISILLKEASSLAGPAEDLSLSEVIEETGPVQCIQEEEEEEEEEGLGDRDLEELIYDGDPLVESDCEDSELLYIRSCISLLSFITGYFD